MGGTFYSDFVLFTCTVLRQHLAIKETEVPAIDPPSREKYPNWKVRPLTKWINYIGTEAWQLGKSI
eukprot:2512139-Ditylum_brightwellii.AAC.1